MQHRRDQAILVLLIGMTLLLGSFVLRRAHAKSDHVRPSSPPKRAAQGVFDRLHNAKAIERTTLSTDIGDKHPDAAGEPLTLDSRSPLSAEIFTAAGPAVSGIFPSFTQPTLLANNDGREDFTADRAQAVDTIGPVVRTAVSEHTFANGFAENVYYIGDTSGDFIIDTDMFPGPPSAAPASDVQRVVDLSALVSNQTSGGFTLVNPIALNSPVNAGCTSGNLVVTGIAVNPVADLSDFGAACGTIGEVVYVSALDTVGCSSNASGQPTRTRIFAFGFTDGTGANAMTPFPNAFQIYSSPLSNAGIALDDDGSLYFHQADVQLTGGAIFKVTETSHTSPVVSGCGATPRINRTFVSFPTLTLTSQTPVTNPGLGIRMTNFSSATPGTTALAPGGLTPQFGNVVALASGPHNVIYAALARSFVSTDDPAIQATEGQFTNPASLGPTPSMIISFADTGGAKDACTTGDPTTGTLPVGDGFADGVVAGAPVLAGRNNFRAFVLGNGPDIRDVNSTIGATPANTLKLDMQIDNSIFAGLMVDEEATVYVVSGGEPAQMGSNPSPNRSEILAFPDRVPFDRRADFIDLRGDLLPNPPNSGGTFGDGDSDRFDHVYWQAPLDPVTHTPGGVSGLARGFLRYTNRLAPAAISPGVTLGSTQSVQADDDTSSAPIFFDLLDPGHQVAGGDDQDTPFRGDDSGGGGTPVLPGAQNGGFEFTFGGNGAPASVYNAFFLNSNGSITFNAGDTSGAPTLSAFRSGQPRIAPAWTNLNPNARSIDPRVFPIQALGFAADNAFKVRWINVPQTGSEICTANGAPTTGSNTFAVTLYDDGTGADENSVQVQNIANPIGNNTVPFDLQEGPTDLRYVKDAITGNMIGSNPRREGSGIFYSDYSRMDLTGSSTAPVIAGYSKGGLAATNPPGLCETNLSDAARSADANLVAIPGQVATINTGLIGDGTEPTIYELFNNGTNVAPEFDLRFEGNDPNASPPTQPDKNRTTVGFFGLGASAPANPQPLTFVADPFVTTPSTSGIANAIGPVTLNILGSGFFPDEATTVCPSGGESAPRSGKTVSTSVTLSLDNDGDGNPDSTIALINVTVVNPHLIRATIPAAAGLPGSAFPLTSNGGYAWTNVTTNFSAGDNNAFGAFTRSAITNEQAIGPRAPVVTSISASSGNCGTTQNVSLSGGSFKFIQLVFAPGPTIATIAVTDVTATEIGNPGNVIHASLVTVADNNNLTASFNFGGASNKSFLIQAINSAGPSRNMVLLPTGAPPPLGNEAGNVINFSCGGEKLQFSAGQTSVLEDVVVAPLTITRTNPSAATVTVDFNTVEGTANQVADYTTMFGTVTFGPGETSKVINIPITQDALVEPDEYLQVTLSNATGGAGIGAQPSEVLLITNDDLAPSSANPIDNATTFVNQHYHDFLSRQGDPSGVSFWTNSITSCVPAPVCFEALRVNTSAAFFLSIEFQETGFNVLRSQRVAFGKKSADPATRYPYLSFLKDAQKVAAGVVIGQPGDLSLLEANKQAYAAQIVSSTPFTTAFPLALTASQYVDALFNTAAVLPTTAERNAAITAFGAGGSAGRVAAFRSVVDSPSVRSAEINPAFVLMEYYGYLRRNPTDAPDGNDNGYQFWLAKLNSFGGNAVAAEMVKAFLNSNEYRQRFNTP